MTLRQQRQQAVVEYLAEHPTITSKSAAKVLGFGAHRASQLLGEMTSAGTLQRRLAERTRKVSIAYIYSLRPPKVEFPPAQWQPEIRIAERETARP